MYRNRQKRLSLSGASSVASLIYALACCASERARALAALSSALCLCAITITSRPKCQNLWPCSCQDRALHVTHLRSYGSSVCTCVQVMGTTGTVLSERVRTRWGSKRSAGGVGSSFHSPLLSTICVCVLRCCSLHACSLVCEAGSFSNFLLSVNDNHYRCKFSSRPPFLAPVRLSC